MSASQGTTEVWIKALGATIDAKDAETFAKHFAEGGSFTFGNGEAVVEPSAIAASCGYFFTMIDGSTHEFVGLSVSGNTVTWQGKCTYVRLDKSTLTVPFCNILKLEKAVAATDKPPLDGANKITSYQIYIDNSELFAPKAPV